ncbi:hypothetical protein Q5O24_12170 [Eubacteriaceae bacterium ES3]|nr:hypothetical protein Q5O24_12170 [Eubacteriaceae bacterium ES3]
MFNKKLRSEQLKKWLFIGVIFILCIAVFVYPEVVEIKNNRVLIGNKERIAAAYQGDLTEEAYLDELNEVVLKLKGYNERIPAEKDQTLYYQSVNKAAEKSGVRLLTALFGDETIVTENDFSSQTINLNNPEGQALYSFSIDLTVAGKQAQILDFIQALEEGSPYLCPLSMSIEEAEGGHWAEIGLKGYYFAK